MEKVGQCQGIPMLTPRHWHDEVHSCYLQQSQSNQSYEEIFCHLLCAVGFSPVYCIATYISALRGSHFRVKSVVDPAIKP